MAAFVALLGRKIFGVAIGYVTAAAASALVVGLAAWAWTDWQDAKAQVAALEAEKARLVQTFEDARRLDRLAQAQLRADLARARATSQRRAGELLAVQADLDAIRQARRPDHEAECPVHPAILTALGQLRGSAGSGGPAGRRADRP